MKILKISFIIMIIVSFTGCRTSHHYYDYDKDIDFTLFNTFNWFTGSTDNTLKDSVKNTIIEKRFRQSISVELENKSFLFTENNPDFFVAYHADTNEKQSISCTYHDHSHGGSFFRGGISLRGGFGVDSCYSNDIDEVLMTIDIIDAKNGTLLWRGWRSDRIYGPTIREDTIRRAVMAIFKNFPPQINK